MQLMRIPVVAIYMDHYGTFPEIRTDAYGSIEEIRTLVDTSQGGMARAGLEYPILKGLTIDLSGSFEVLEAPPGTNNFFSFVSGLTYRI